MAPESELDRFEPDSSEAPSHVLAAISAEIIHRYKERFGRGPTKTRTRWCGPDIVVVMLEDTLTPAERNLVRMGEHQRVRDTRLCIADTGSRDVIAVVERLTGRRVRAYVSGIDTAADGLVVDTFVLHPGDSEAVSRAEGSPG